MHIPFPAARSGLPWPEAYGDLLPAMQQEWGIDNAIYLTRQLNGDRSI